MECGGESGEDFRAVHDHPVRARRLPAVLHGRRRVVPRCQTARIYVGGCRPSIAVHFRRESMECGAVVARLARWFAQRCEPRYRKPQAEPLGSGGGHRDLVVQIVASRRGEQCADRSEHKVCHDTSVRRADRAREAGLPACSPGRTGAEVARCMENDRARAGSTPAGQGSKRLCLLGRFGPELAAAGTRTRSCASVVSGGEPREEASVRTGAASCSPRDGVDALGGEGCEVVFEALLRRERPCGSWPTKEPSRPGCLAPPSSGESGGVHRGAHRRWLDKTRTREHFQRVKDRGNIEAGRPLRSSRPLHS
jgi:hypothetical protein